MSAIREVEEPVWIQKDVVWYWFETFWQGVLFKEMLS
jgi:hypothetical protein